MACTGHCESLICVVSSCAAEPAVHAPDQVADKLAGVLERAVQAVDAQEEGHAGAGEQCQHEAPGGSSKWEQPAAAGTGGSRWGPQPAAAGTSPGSEGSAEVFEAAASVMDLRQVGSVFFGISKEKKSRGVLSGPQLPHRAAAGMPMCARLPASAQQPMPPCYCAAGGLPSSGAAVRGRRQVSGSAHSWSNGF